ncbi:MAG: hypothetical protein RLZZ507_1390 [Cyanobacteriota bacterium]|jgi:hypothetical protein
MSYLIIASECFFELSDQQQELLTGGNQPQISNNNFYQKDENITETNSNNPLGKVSQTNTDFTDVNSGAQSMLSSNTPKAGPFTSSNNLVPNIPISVNRPLGMF